MKKYVFLYFVKIQMYCFIINQNPVYNNRGYTLYILVQ